MNKVKDSSSSADIMFLKEIKERIIKYENKKDVTQLEMVKTMIDDWIIELEKNVLPLLSNKKEDTVEEEKDYVASVPPNDVAPVVSLTASSGNSIEQRSKCPHCGNEVDNTIHFCI